MCSNSEFGDPHKGKKKRCMIRRSTWTKCAEEGGTCTAKGESGKVLLVRYGSGKYYNIIPTAGTTTQTFPCQDGEILKSATTDPKTCEYKTVTDWGGECSKEAQPCSFEGPAVIKYEVESDPKSYRQSDLRYLPMYCHSPAFGGDPKNGVFKVCKKYTGGEKIQILDAQSTCSVM